MSATDKKNGRAEAAEKSCKTRHLATRIVALRDRFTLTPCRFAPKIQWVLTGDCLVGLVAAVVILVAWRWA